MKGTAHEHQKGVRVVLADAHGVGAVNGSGIDTQGFDELLVIISIDDVGGAGTVDFKMQESSDDGVADAYADITGAAISQKSAVGLFVGRLDLAKDRERYVRGVLTIGTNAVDACVLGTLSEFKYPPVSQVAAAEFNV